MSGRGARGLRGLLTASCLFPSPIPFRCTPKTFDNPDGTTTQFEIVRGVGKMRVISDSSQSSPEKEEKSPNSKLQNTKTPKTKRASPTRGGTFEWQTTNDAFNKAFHVPKSANDDEDAREDNDSEFKERVRVENGELIGGEDDELIPAFVAIAEHLETNVGILFDGIVTDFRVEFGVTRKGRIYLLSGSVSTTVNPFVRNIMREIPNGESEFVEFISKELAAPKSTGSKCITGSPKCHKAEYRIPRLFVMLYRARMRWPQVNEARLYKVIKQRLQRLDPDVAKESCSVCVLCLHMYSAEQKRYYGQKLANKQHKYLSAMEFQDLVPGDMSVQARREVTMVSDPCCYTINLERSPYKGKLIEPRAPPPPPARTPQPEIPKSGKWVERLTSDALTPARVREEESTGVTDVEMSPQDPLPCLEMFEPAKQGFAEKPALRSYRKQPFGYAFIDRMNRIAARNVKRIQKKRNEAAASMRQ